MKGFSTEGLGALSLSCFLPLINLAAHEKKSMKRMGGLLKT